MSNIDWTNKTWNPVIGCARVSEGCRNCYAERMAVRVANMGLREYDGLTNGNLRKPRWTGEVRFLPGRIDEPRHWRKPTVVFVNSMSDLLHEGLGGEQIGEILAVMRDTPRHTYQILTKRPERLSELHDAGVTWPDNVWLGVSVEDQKSADHRIPLLTARRYAPVLWVSYEPALGPVDWHRWAAKLDWIVIGGESGPGCRPFDLAWARSTIRAFQAVGKAVFMKQVGGQLAESGGKGNDPEGWPADLRVRQYPSELESRPRMSLGMNQQPQDGGL
jgi:protein gp37